MELSRFHLGKMEEHDSGQPPLLSHQLRKARDQLRIGHARQTLSVHTHPIAREKLALSLAAYARFFGRDPDVSPARAITGESALCRARCALYGAHTCARLAHRRKLVNEKVVISCIAHRRRSARDEIRPARGATRSLSLPQAPGLAPPPTSGCLRRRRASCERRWLSIRAGLRRDRTARPGRRRCTIRQSSGSRGNRWRPRSAIAGS